MLILLQDCLFCDVQVITCEQRNSKQWELTDEGKEIAEKGSHEALIYRNIPLEGINQNELLVSNFISAVGFLG